MSTRRRWAWPLVPLYAAGLRVKDALRGAPKHLQRPVISIGSLSAGGAGKTPVVIALAELLQARGWTVDVLSRGYGRSSDDVAHVDLARDDAHARFGDEPVLIAQRAAVDVWVGRSRFEAGLAAETVASRGETQILRSTQDDNPLGSIPSSAPLQRSTRVHLLDDGFQHRQLARNFDVVLVTAEDLRDALLPAGNRREPLTALRRADAVVVRAEERDRVSRRVREWMRADAEVWIIRRRLRFPAPLAVLSAGLRPLAFCAVARPEDFAASLRAAGCGLVDTLAFRDHHRYTAADMDDIVATAQRLNVTGFVTTEKDAVKLTSTMREQLARVGPLVVARLEVEFGDPDGVIAALERRLR